MKRSWAVRPDETGTVSRQALVDAFVDAATILDLAGGCLEVVVGRTPTGVPHEMVMNGALLVWRDRTDAKDQPEVAASVMPGPPRLTDEAREAVIREADTPEEGHVEVARIEAEAREAVVVTVPPAGPEPDGFDYSKLEEEDIEEPAVTR